MLNIYELEKRWFYYKIKVYLPYFFIMIFLGLILTFLVFLLNEKKTIQNSSTLSKEKIEVNTTSITPQNPIIPTPILKIPEEQVVPKQVIPKEQVIPKNEVKKVVLSPSVSFIETIVIETNVTNKDITKPTLEEITPIEVQPVIKKIVKFTAEVPKEEIITRLTEENQKIQITKQHTSNDIAIVIRRFKTNNNPALSLFIAKKYYEIDNFEQSYNYALITNQLNKDIEDSWIIFAKSLIKLKKKQKAIEVLKQYIQYSNSNKAEILLANIISGKFQ